MLFWNLLTEAGEVADQTADQTTGCTLYNSWPLLLIIGAFAVLWFFSRRSQKKQQDQINATLDAIQPGNKVKTIGGICGVVVEVCPEDNTFVMETGSETSGKSYIKLDKKAVYQTDAVPTPVEEVPAEETQSPAEEAPFEEAQAPVEEEPFEEAQAPVEETPAEESAEETETKEE